MFKRAATAFRPQLRSIHTRASAAPRAHKYAFSAASAVVVGSTVWYNAKSVHNDAEITADRVLIEPVVTAVSFTRKCVNLDALYSLAWGSNRRETIIPGGPTKEDIREPTTVPCFDGVALRDLQIHKTYGACVDARGNVYQWGQGFFESLSDGFHSPKLTLKGKNIVQLQLTENKVYALSASGKIYTLSSKSMKQDLEAGNPTPSSDSWWGTGWLWGEDANVDFLELEPSDKLAWGESFSQIAAGDNHLLAVTSKGRVFSHPVNKMANHYGQLGFRQFDIPDPASAITKQNVHLHVDLIPKSLSDPYGSSTRSVRVSSTSSTGSTTGADLSNIDDSNIRFCNKIYELPVLRGVASAQVAAGARTSFVRTKDGRVLAWGANEYGQLGLGANVALDTITVPTEVILWRFVPNDVETKCTNITAAGDLTAFVVERHSGNAVATTDILMSGNGQYGGLGNNLYTTSQGNPLTIKTLSGLVQYNDRTKKLDPIVPEEINISPTGHVLAALNSSADSEGVGGRDLMVWGRNYDSELGNGKRGSIAVPSTLDVDGDRFMLMSRKAKEVKDLQGRVWKKNVNVSQHVAAGYANSIVYWKIE